MEDLAAVFLSRSHLHSHRMVGAYQNGVLSQNPYNPAVHALGLMNIEPRKDVGEYVVKAEKVYLVWVFQINMNSNWAIVLDK